MSGHTPGPWEIGTETRGSEICTIYGVPTQPTEDGKGQEWVYIHYPMVIDGEWHWAGEDEKIANARLIAAAPDLLEALQDLVNSFETHRPKQLWDNARAAIAKATGAQ